MFMDAADATHRKKLRFISALSFPLGFLDAFFIYIISSYFAEVAGSEHIGWFYIAAFSLVFASLVWLQPLVRRLGLSSVLFYLFLVLVGSAAWLSASGVNFLGALFLLVFLVANNVLWVVMDILLEQFSVDRISGRVRGFYLTIMNAGLLVAPFFATHVLEYAGYAGVFAFLTIGYAVTFIIALVGLAHTPRLNFPKLSWQKTKSTLSAHPDLLRIYHISFAMEFFYAIMVVYMPLYLIQAGFSWEEIGLLFTAMLLPFVLFQYPLGAIADRHFGEKELLMGSLFIVIVATAGVCILHTPSLWWWGAMLFATRVGIAGIEVLRDAYFYKHVHAEDADHIAFFRTARPSANIVGALVALALLAFFPMQSLFLVVVGVMLSACVSGFFLRDTASEAEGLT